MVTWPMTSRNPEIIKQSGHMNQLGDTYQEGNSMNRDEGSYQLSHICDNLFAPKLSGERQLETCIQ